MENRSKVNVERIKEWIKELRSGRYTRCSGELTDGTNYCCLGVLCQINGLLLTKGTATYGRYYYHFQNETNADVLPKAFLNYIGLTDNQQRALSQMNDGGSTFLEIADYLERKYVND